MVLSCLLQNHLYVKAEKCEFHQHLISFLGYIINSKGVSMDPSKVSAVMSWPMPTSIKELQCFLGFVNFYHHFIWGFSLIAIPLTALLKKGPKRLQWNPMAEEAFGCLKQAFTSAPILQHLDPSKPFTLEVNASDMGVGAVLSQRFGEKQKLYPVVFFSKKLSSTERNYNVGNRNYLP
ncbi:uncharacterized protein LOC132888837 [Neoarius graeffei]|uniref:uncharacterized protein LOC132888837 n=1 Tax=Neoarius graeffei TaxID=443677 RepID=UPI00298CE200|nr:uncharacterized protein LOC132888837 [Neoarius graeffei]